MSTQETETNLDATTTETPAPSPATTAADLGNDNEEGAPFKPAPNVTESPSDAVVDGSAATPDGGSAAVDAERGVTDAA